MSRQRPEATRTTSNSDSPGTEPGRAELRDFTGSDRTADGIELTQFRVLSRTSKPTAGDTITVEFSLRNAGDDSISLTNTFVGARFEHERKDFGEANQEKRLAPGATVTTQQYTVVDRAGVWKFWPCYEMAGHYCPDEWNSFPVNVGGG